MLLDTPYVLPVIIGVSILTLPSFSPIFIAPVDSLYIPWFSVDVTLVVPIIFIDPVDLLYIPPLFAFIVEFFIFTIPVVALYIASLVVTFIVASLIFKLPLLL